VLEQVSDHDIEERGLANFIVLKARGAVCGEQGGSNLADGSELASVRGEWVFARPRILCTPSRASVRSKNTLSRGASREIVG
jgi:hypothetical protein